MPRRELFTDDRGRGLRATWHAERDMVVLSLWHDDVCTGSVRLELAEATRLAVFLTGHLGEQAVERERGDESFTDTQLIPLPAPPRERP